MAFVSLGLPQGWHMAEWREGRPSVPQPSHTLLGSAGKGAVVYKQGATPDMGSDASNQQSLFSTSFEHSAKPFMWISSSNPPITL